MPYQPRSLHYDRWLPSMTCIVHVQHSNHSRHLSSSTEHNFENYLVWADVQRTFTTISLKLLRLYITIGSRLFSTLVQNCSFRFLLHVHNSYPFTIQVMQHDVSSRGLHVLFAGEGTQNGKTWNSKVKVRGDFFGRPDNEQKIALFISVSRNLI